MHSSQPLRLGSLELRSRFILAPLESVSDAAFRRLCYQLGASFTWTEMLRANAMARNNKSTLALIDTVDPATPTGVQLFAVNERELEAALNALDEGARGAHPHFTHIRAVDLNFGCPSPDVIRVGGGPALLKRPTKLRTMFETLKAWKARTRLPIGAVGAKIRLGLSAQEQKDKVYLRAADAADGTLDYLTVHARHAKQDSQTPAAWEAIAEVKARLRIPIIGNGDVFSLAAAEKLQLQTGCDGVLIARGAIRSPWIFRELTHAGSGQPTLTELEAAERQYFADAERWQTRPKHLAWHREGFARIRARLTGQPLRGADTPQNSHMVASTSS